MQLYKIMMNDTSGALSCEDFAAALRKMGFEHSVHFTPSDFASFTRNGALCDADGKLDEAGFEAAMREQLLRFSIARLAEVGACWMRMEIQLWV
mmetsp:Transcript_52350/g.136925  ORF Transcript_52350/g.136925 Transcript_52350/m.136925 type:complete len:94 (+) Transcript_52350:1571-1852(+)